jgi:hypothetical protein
MKKTAHSRYLLPMEALLGALSVGMGVAGIFGRTILHAALTMRGEDITWFAFFFGIGAARVMVSLWEWRYLRGAAEPTVYQFTSVRASLAFACLFTWTGALKIIVLGSLSGQMPFIVAVAVLAVSFNLWSFWENYKVRCALNPRLHTTNLVFSPNRRV